MRRAGRIAAKRVTGKTDEAGNLVALLHNRASVKHQHVMQLELAAGRHDLVALRVDATSTSNSETGWEREE